MSSSPAASTVQGHDGLDFAPPSAALEAAAQALGFPGQPFLRHEAAVEVDRLLTRVARSRGALDVGLAERLAALADGDRLLRLGFSGTGDYARERLGVAARTAQGLVHLGRGLRRRPLLRAALRTGLVSLRAAQAVLPVATGEDEAAWVELACTQTVRALTVAVRRQLAGVGVLAGGHEVVEVPGALEATLDDGCASPGWASLEVDEDVEAWQRIAFAVGPAARGALDEALEVAGRMLGEGSPRWQRLEGLAQEYLGAHPSAAGEDDGALARVAGWQGARHRGPALSPDETQPPGWLTAGWRAEYEAFLEGEVARWAWLETIDAVPAPGLLLEAPSPVELDASLRALVRLRNRWDRLLGHLGLVARRCRLWRWAGFASFAHYCRERLGLGVRSVEQRIALERRLGALPALRQALEAGRLSTEQARQVATVAVAPTVEGWVAHAEGVSCVVLRREVEALKEVDGAASWVAPPVGTAQVCAAQAESGLRRALVPAEAVLRGAMVGSAGGVLRMWLPGAVAGQLAAAFGAAERVEGRRLSDSECLERVATHFVQTWGGLPAGRRTPQRTALQRDGHLCQVPGCSRGAVHAHHIVYRSRGGSDAPENLVSLCAAHHLHGVHRGWVRVRGTAPDGLSWELGEARLE